MANEYDLNIGRQVVSMGMINPDQLSICLKIQQKQLDTGKYYSLLDILMRKKFISPEQVARLHATSVESTIPVTEIHKAPNIINNRYQVICEIGKGGMGVVYKAWDQNFERNVAIKFLRYDKAQSHHSARFLREARAMSKLQHQNIVKIYDMDTTDDYYYITMEYIEGVTLRKYMLTNNISSRNAARICLEILKAIDHAHENLIIHRDIKPDNIIITPEGQVKVMDFGLAKIVEENISISNSGSAIGTVHYMSPEQMLGLRKIDARSDIYSIGVTLYEILTGRTPFVAKSFQEALHKIKKPFLKPHLIKPKVPHQLSQICLKAIAHKKPQRYQSATSFIEDINNFLENKKNSHAIPKQNILFIVFVCTVLATATFLYFKHSKNVPIAQENQNKQEKVPEQTINNNTQVHFRGNQQRTGNYDESPFYQMRGVKWRFLTKEKIKSSPIVHNNKVYFGSYDYFFYCLDAENGHFLWQFATENYIYSSPVIAGNIIYFGCHDSYLYALNIDTGKEIWRFRSSDHILSSPVVSEDNIYFGCQDGKLYSLNKNNGSFSWSFSTKDSILSSPAIYKDTIFFGSNDKNLYALNKKNQTLKWKFPTGGIVKSTPAIINDTIYFGSFDTFVYALDTNGEMLWRHKCNDQIHSSPAVTNNTLYIGSNDNHLYALTTNTGQLVWKYNTGSPVAMSPIIAKDMLYFGSLNGRFYAINRSNNKLLWHFDASLSFSSPTISNNTIFIGSYDNYFYALH